MSHFEDSDESEGEDIPEMKEPQKAEVLSSRSGRIELQASDFFFGATLGEGSFARVVHAKFKRNDAEFAVKIMDKMHIKREKKVKYVMTERQILSMLSHHFIVKFHFSFQDTGYLYMCMELAPGGDLLHLINLKLDSKTNQGIEDEACSFEETQFYISEIIEALEFIHSKQVIHRDLKPENVLLSAEGHIRITDFGTAVILTESDENERTSFVGTQDYVSPEVLAGDKSATKACDLWAVGCMVYQMMTGLSPFREATEYLTFTTIMAHCDGTKPLTFPPVLDGSPRALINAFLVPKMDDRLGAGEDATGNSYDKLKKHEFFAGIEWGNLINKKPPYIPDRSTFPTTDNMRDGALDEWLLEGEATPIVYERKPNTYTDAIDRIKSSNSAGFKEEATLRKFLYSNEKQVFTGIIYKRKGLFSRRRQLILTDMPRLVYFDPETMELKGEIHWSLQFPIKCTQKNQQEFDVKCSKSGRTYHLSDAVAGAQIWCDLITALEQKQEDIRRQRDIKLSTSTTTSLA